MIQQYGKQEKPYIEKRMRRSTDPGGAPEEQFRVDDVEFPRRTVCDCPVLYMKKAISRQCQIRQNYQII